MKSLSHAVFRIACHALPVAAFLAGPSIPAPAQPANSGQGGLVAPREGNRSGHRDWQPAAGPVQHQEKQAGVGLSPQQRQAQDRELGRIASQLTNGRQSTVTGPSGNSPSGSGAR